MILCANPRAQYETYQAEIESAISKVLRSNQYILGLEVKALEQEFSEYIGSNFAIGVANGSDAIELALRALNIGIGDEVITVSHTAVATVAAIEAAGATPVLVDIEETYCTLDHSKLKEVLTAKTKAIIVVHIYGQAADLDPIDNFCKENNLYLIEDASQAHGAKYKNKRVGSIGHIGCFSCYPTKNLGGIGDAGLITTNDIKINSKIRMIREYGWRNRYVSDMPGRNSRLDELQAAILRVKLKYLDKDNTKRNKIAFEYTKTIIGEHFILPKIMKNTHSVFHLYVIKTNKRDKLQEHLQNHQIQTGIHYPVPIHLQPAYIGRIRTSKSMRVTEDIAKKVISLPIYPELPLNQCRIVCDVINDFFKNKV